MPEPGIIQVTDVCSVCRAPRSANQSITHFDWCFRRHAETKMIPATLEKLIQAFGYGCTDTEACNYAKIHPNTLARFMDDNPDFADYRDQLRMGPILRARKKVVDSIDDDSDIAKWFLERRMKAEFSPRTEVTGRDGVDLPTPILVGLLKAPNEPEEPKGIIDALE